MLGSDSNEESSAESADAWQGNKLERMLVDDRENKIGQA